MITSFQNTRIGPNSYRATAATDVDPPLFYWYFNGGLVAAGNLPFHDFTLAFGEPGRIDVFDSPTDIPPISFPSRARLEWENLLDAKKFRIYARAPEVPGFDEFTQRAMLPATRRGSMSWPSPVLSAGVLFEFRVVPIAADGNEGAARMFSIPMVREPDPPVATFEYDPDTGIDTVDE